MPHVAKDRLTRRAMEAFYLDVFAAQTYYEAVPVEGLERHESFILIGDVCILPLSPSDPESGQGQLLLSYAGSFSQIAIKVPEIPPIEEHLVTHGITPVFLRRRHRNLFFTTDPEQTLGIRFEFCAANLPNDLRLRSGWSAAWWREQHPLGIVGLDSVVTTGPDLAGATSFYTEVFGLEHLGNRQIPDVGAMAAAFRVGTDAPFVIEHWQPQASAKQLGHLAESGRGIYGMTFRVRSLEAASRYLRSKGLQPAWEGRDRLAIRRSDAFGASLMMVEQGVLA